MAEDVVGDSTGTEPGMSSKHAFLLAVYNNSGIELSTCHFNWAHMLATNYEHLLTMR